MSRFTWAMYCGLDGFLVKLADGWRLPWIVGPMAGPHGTYSVLLTREEPCVRARTHNRHGGHDRSRGSLGMLLVEPNVPSSERNSA